MDAIKFSANPSGFRVNDVVTWGLGEPRARIESIKTMMSDAGELIARAELVLTSSCATTSGTTIPPGSLVLANLSNIRRVQLEVQVLANV